MQAIISLIILVLDIIAIVEVLKSSAESGKKILWVLVIIFLPLLGLVLYYLIGKSQLLVK